ncbi:hypothetical protein AVEN_61065-1 [Araneus ventricosus]|uniref:Uncharacterized protein n=1 Tax=Araneus ventricosus TaxID=182803 RepID=A0A4Y2UGU3_ARAVE|nr:hypothetical protein AVEN_61065-1 [Araneus ventricosus]
MESKPVLSQDNDTGFCNPTTSTAWMPSEHHFHAGWCSSSHRSLVKQFIKQHFTDARVISLKDSIRRHVLDILAELRKIWFCD